MPSEVLSPTFTITQTPSPTLTPTLTQTPQPSATPLPTLTQDERLNYVQNLLITNANCRLPCWWGITPGKTSWAETEEFLQYMGITTSIYPRESGPVFHSTGGFDFSKQYVFNGLVIFESDGVVVSIEVHGDGFHNPTDFKTIWASFAPELIIPAYGLPSRVWIDSIATVHEGQPGPTMPYEVWVFYDHLGILLRYKGQVVYQSTYEMCPVFGDEGNLGQGLDLFLQFPESNLPLEDLSDFNHIGESLVLPLEKATELTIDEFFGLFAQQNKSPCFETSRDIWP